MKRTVILLAYLICSPLAQASGGAWSGEAVGGTVSVGGQTLVSRPLSPSLPATARLHRISWRITLLSSPPPGLAIKLCSQDKCVVLPALSGGMNIDTALTRHGPFYFIYSVQSKGQLIPVLNVVKNQLTINYHERRD